MNEPKIPSQYKDWEAIDIFLFSNGQQYSPPRKYHLRSEELNWWDATLGFLARSQYGSNVRMRLHYRKVPTQPKFDVTRHSLTNLYTLKGQRVGGPMELSNGVAYVAVLPQDSFIDAGYEKYVIKATRSWEKRQSRLSSSLGERTPEEVAPKNEPAKTDKEESVHVEIPRHSFMTDTTDQNKIVEEAYKLGKPISFVDTKHGNKIGSLPNNLKNVSNKSAERRRTKAGDPPPTVPNAPEPKLSSKIPMKKGESPASNFFKSALESNESINTTAPSKKILKRPKTPLKPYSARKVEPIVTRKIPTKITVPHDAKKSLAKNTGQTTDIAQIDNVDENDVIVVSNLYRNSESDIMSTVLDVNAANLFNNATQNSQKSLNNAPKKTEVEMSMLPVIKEQVTANNTSEYTHLDTNFDVTKNNSQITPIEYSLITPQSLWDNTINTQVPLKGNIYFDDKPTVNDLLQKKSEITNNMEVPITNNNTRNKDGISVDATSIQDLNEFGEKPGGGSLMGLVNKGDIISFKLNLEVRNTDGVVHTVLKTNMTHPEAKFEKNSNDKKNSHVSINDDGKSIQLALDDDQCHTCMCCQRKQKIIFKCACCDCNYNQTDTSRNNINEANNEAKSYFVILPVATNYNNERLREHEVANNLETGIQNIGTLKQINRVISATEMVIVTSTKSKHDKMDNAIQMKENPDLALRISEVSKTSFVTNQMVAKKDYKMPDIKPWDDIVVKHDISQSMSGQPIPEIQIQTNSKNILQDKAIQTEWHNILMEIRKCKDGHYTFYLPPLSMLRRYNVPPF